jgi:DNA-binding transcriptional LysR family regulator
MNFMSEVIGNFITNRPDVSIYLHDDASRTVLELVSLHHYDIGVAFAKGDYPGVVLVPLPTLCAECVVPDTHRLSDKEVINPTDLEGETLISLGMNSLLRMQLDAVLAEQNVTCQRRVETTFAMSACDMVSRGMGVALVDPFTANAYSSRGVRRKKFAPAVPYDFAIVLPSGKAPPRLVEEFQATIQQAVDRLPFERL